MILNKTTGFTLLNNFSKRKIASKRHLTGFTLIEVLISITIISTITFIMFAAKGQQKYQLALQRSSYQLAQDMRRAQEMGMSTKEFNGVVPQGGYGIYCDLLSSTTTYILFADINNNTLYDGVSEKVEQKSLEEKIYISSFTPAFASSLTIVFSPPDPSIILTTNTGSTTTIATVFLKSESNPGNARSVEINAVGLINVN